MTKATKNQEFLLDSVARGFIRNIGSFGVGVGVGVAPFLGEIPVPGFRPLLQIFPHEVRGELLAMAPLLLGFVAVAVKFYLGEEISRTTLRRWFMVALVGSIACFVVLTYVDQSVIKVPQDKGYRLAIVGETRKPDCPCNREPVADEDCLKGIQFKASLCWNSRELKNTEFAFKLTYLFVNFGFGVVVGIIMLQRRSLDRERQQARILQASKAENAPVEDTPTQSEKPPTG